MGLLGNLLNTIRRGLRTQVGIGAVVATTLIALVALTAALILGFRQSAHMVDAMVRSDESELVGNYLEEASKLLISQQVVQLTWDDAFNAVGQDRDYAWADAYLGKFLHQTFALQRLYLVDSRGRVLRAWEGGRPTALASFAQYAPQVRQGLSEMSRNRAVLGKPAAFRRLADTIWPFDANGRPLTRWTSTPVRSGTGGGLLTITPLLPDTDYAQLTRTPNHLVSVRAFDAAFLEELGQRLLMTGVRFEAAPTSDARNLYPVRDSAGAVLGYISWDTIKISTMIRGRVAPLFIAYLCFLLAVLVGGVAIVRALLGAMRELRASESLAQHNALHDAMTGLANRAQFLAKLEDALITQQLGSDRSVIVAYVDIDHFKLINDTLGHHIGDELICQVAGRLQRHLKPGDFMARLGGDEFVIMRTAHRDSAEGLIIGRDMIALFAEPVPVFGHIVDVTISCGVSWGPDHGADAGALLQSADIALYRAKQRGRGRWRAFMPEMQLSVRWRHELEVELRRALTTDELRIVYQPIVAAADGRVEGVEALLRWRHPERGDIGPGEFVPVAEQCGLMVSLGDFVLRRVFEDMARWESCEVSINLSPLQLTARGFNAKLRALVDELGLDTGRVVFEVTEGVLLDPTHRVLSVLREMREMGFRIALDDFGTGYSSLSYLRTFQFDRIKIDRTFVNNIESDRDAQAILTAIVALGRQLRMKVVAEGVETVSQRLLVHAAGCQLLQGHLFYAALSREDVAEVLREQRTRKAG